eukprot:12408022-Karenia_brevis.AAC.1
MISGFKGCSTQLPMPSSGESGAGGWTNASTRNKLGGALSATENGMQRSCCPFSWGIRSRTDMARGNAQSLKIWWELLCVIGAAANQ